MAYPNAVTVKAKVTPRGFDTNIAATISPASLQHFDYFPGYTFTSGDQLRVLNTAGVAWWLADAPPPTP